MRENAQVIMAESLMAESLILAHQIKSSDYVARVSDSRFTEGAEEGSSLLWFVPDLAVA